MAGLSPNPLSERRGCWQDLFAARFDVLLYDLTSTYFESDPPADAADKRRYGYSRDKRNDCVQVVIALVVTPEGFPLDLKRRGLSMGPELAVADGALGFWQALEEVWPRTRGQRCWVHKTANVLNKLPKSQQSKAKRALQEIWMAETKKDALLAFDAFIETWGVKYDRATECLIKDRDTLLAFYDFPAEH